MQVTRATDNYQATFREIHEVWANPQTLNRTLKQRVGSMDVLVVF